MEQKSKYCMNDTKEGSVNGMRYVGRSFFCVEKKSLFYILTEKIAEIMPCYQIKK